MINQFYSNIVIPIKTKNYLNLYSKTNSDLLKKTLCQSKNLRKVRFSFPLSSNLVKSTIANTCRTITSLMSNINGPTMSEPNANGPTVVAPNINNPFVLKPSTKNIVLRRSSHNPNRLPQLSPKSDYNRNVPDVNKSFNKNLNKNVNNKSEMTLFSDCNWYPTKQRSLNSNSRSKHTNISGYNKNPTKNPSLESIDTPSLHTETPLSYSSQVKLIPNSSVFTIGNVTLSRPQIDLLEKGLSFIPLVPINPDPNLIEIDNLADPINKTICKLRHNKEVNDGSYLTLKGLDLLKTKTPFPTTFNYTTEMIANLHSSHSLTHSTTSNLNEQELKVIKSLKNNPYLIIKPVDKNLGIAVIERSIYIKIAELQHLSDTSTYTKLDNDPLVETVDHINKTLLRLHDNFSITNKTYKQLTIGQNSSNGVFYILPKLHKGKLDSRPICANSNHPTKAISEYLHSLMLPIARNSLSFLDNSLELTKLLNCVSTNSSTLIITADIKSLYTRIPTIEGPSLVANVIRNENISANTIETLLSLVLKNNIFTFNNNFYRQKNGTAMGTIMAPSYANCFLKAKEEPGLRTWLTPGHPNVKLFKRYIDDILVIFNNNDNKLPQFLNDMRSAYHPLELTFKIGKTSITYLDTELTINDSLNKIDYELHRKPCNNKSYTPANSNHPNHMLENTVFNDYLRAHRLCNSQLKLLKHTSIITAKAIKRGYKKKTLKRLLHQARNKAFGSKIKISNDEGVISTFASLTYTGSRTKSLATNFRKNWNSTADPCTKIKLSFKTMNNLKKILVRSKAPLPLC
jgi:Reverse transcriptase (RNA-dependent DNA polymerase)